MKVKRELMRRDEEDAKKVLEAHAQKLEERANLLSDEREKTAREKAAMALETQRQLEKSKADLDREKGS